MENRFAQQDSREMYDAAETLVWLDNWAKEKEQQKIELIEKIQRNIFECNELLDSLLLKVKFRVVSK